jgi:dipeptidyl aminopeptidase/acylaminoacyl peptidase
VTTVTPYGAWGSPVTAELATAGMTAGLIAVPSYVGLLGEEVWWVEPRPQEDGRMVLMRRQSGGSAARALPPGPWNVRSRVIEYGGRPWAAVDGDQGVLVVFVHFADQRLYAYQDGDAAPRPLTPVSPVGAGLRWAEPEIDPVRGEVRYVLEEFTGVAQAEWAADGSLLAAFERTGWWNLYRVDPESGAAQALRPADEDFAGAQPLGLRWFAPLADGRVAVLHGVGAQRLALLDPARGELVDVHGDRSEWLPYLAVSGTRIVGVAAGSTTSYEVVEVDAATMDLRVAGYRHRPSVDPAYLPEPVTRVFTGNEGREIQANLYAPRNPDVTGPDGGLPPYVIWAHGGPALRAPLALNLEIAYFTSRGIGVADVNYGGTPGYGCAYRKRLREGWGVVDVEDCAAVARALVEERLAAEGRVAIRGVSAGGFTAAESLAATDVYACATLICPVLDLATLASGQTHDFESHYLESLVGPLARTPERYHDRSPAAHPDKITAPFLLLQGADDVICPAAHGEEFLMGVAVPYARRLFDGEGHGFRRRDTMIAGLEAELSLYGQVFGFTPPGVPLLELRT